MRRKRFVLACLVTIVALGASGCGSSTGPSAVVLSVSGSWDVTITGPGGTLPSLMILTEANGAVTGTFQITSDTASLSGTISQAGEMALAGRTRPGNVDTLFRVTVDASRRSFAGTVSFTFLDETLGGSAVGTKR